MQEACQLGHETEKHWRKFICVRYGKADFSGKKKAFLTEGLFIMTV
jgi:hypothetical protein